MQGPHNLDLARFGEGGEFLGRQGVKGDLLVPRLAVGADDDLAVRVLGQQAPAHAEGPGDQTTWAVGPEGFAAEQVGTARSQNTDLTKNELIKSMSLATW
jgi:hypothetical protein